MIPADDKGARIPQPSRFACPKSHGALLEIKARDDILFRCRTGHEYSLEGLMGAVRVAIDQSLWIALRSLEEFALLMKHSTSHRPQEGGHSHGDRSGARDEARKHAGTLRQLLSDRDSR